MGKIGKIENVKKKDFNKFRKTRTHCRHTPKAIVSGEDFDNAVPSVDADVRKHSPGKSKKKENAGEYFVPTKKRKVWKLMRFLEKNKDVGIGDDYVVTVGGKEILGSDFIDIMHCLMKSGGKEDVEKTFYPSLDESTGMPTGTKQFISALYHSIEKKPLMEKLVDTRRKILPHNLKHSPVLPRKGWGVFWMKSSKTCITPLFRWRKEM